MEWGMAIIVTSEAQVKSITLNFAIVMCLVLLTITSEKYTHNIDKLCSDCSQEID